MRPASAAVNASVENVSYGIGKCALGQVLVTRSIKGVCGVLIGADRVELSQSSKRDLIRKEALA
jgi:hypothetical protein